MNPLIRIPPTLGTGQRVDLIHVFDDMGPALLERPG